MKKLLLIVSVLFLASCEEKPDYVQGNSQREGSQSIVYFKDTRTGFCYAERGVGKTYSFTCVPCSEEVENLIRN